MLNICQFTNILHRERRRSQQNMHLMTHFEDEYDLTIMNGMIEGDMRWLKLEMAQTVESAGRYWALSGSADLHIHS
jgi:hypothetical protein